MAHSTAAARSVRALQRRVSSVTSGGWDGVHVRTSACEVPHERAGVVRGEVPRVRDAAGRVRLDRGADARLDLGVDRRHDLRAVGAVQLVTVVVLGVVRRRDHDASGRADLAHRERLPTPGPQHRPQSRE